MTKSTRTKMLEATLALGLIAGGVTPAIAQAGDWKAARAAGLIGEQADGYLGIVGAGNAQLEAMVKDINIKRKAAYTEKARQTSSTVEQFALTSGCNLIELTPAGSKYQTPNGQWMTRGSDAPVRHPSCV